MQHISQHLDTCLEPVVGDLVPIAGHLFRGVGVEYAARPLDRGGAPWRALEHHVLQEMR